MITTDKFLDGRVLLKQPAKGYRAGVDAVLLAAAVKLKVSDRVLDVGAGVGAVSLCLSYYYPHAQVVGLEIQPPMAVLNQQNIILNQAENVSIFEGSILSPPAALVPNSFEHVVTNPPFFDYGPDALSDSDAKATARHEKELDLGTWLTACMRMVKPRGYLTLIHRVDRLDEILTILRVKAGGIKVFPLWPNEQEASKLVIIQVRKGVKTHCQLLRGLVLHEADGQYTRGADSILRGNGRIFL